MSRPATLDESTDQVGPGSAVADLLRRTRTDRGLPATITDQRILDRLTAIVTAGDDA